MRGIHLQAQRLGFDSGLLVLQNGRLVLPTSTGERFLSAFLSRSSSTWSHGYDVRPVAPGSVQRPYSSEWGLWQWVRLSVEARVEVYLEKFHEVVEGGAAHHASHIPERLGQL